MDKIEVDSSFIHTVGYDKEKKRLEVIIDNDDERKYVYKNVSEYVYQNFLDSNSKGRYYNENIKGEYDSIPVSTIAGMI